MANGLSFRARGLRPYEETKVPRRTRIAAPQHLPFPRAVRTSDSRRRHKCSGLTPLYTLPCPCEARQTLERDVERDELQAYQRAGALQYRTEIGRPL